jgi:hypothetical protein
MDEQTRIAMYCLLNERVELLRGGQRDFAKAFHLPLYERLPFATVFRVLRLRQDGLQLYIRAYCSLIRCGPL